MEALRQLPSVNDILNAAELEAFRPMMAHPIVGRLLNDILSTKRAELTQTQIQRPRPELLVQIASELANRLKALTEPKLRRVINASGVVLHTNLGRAPL